MEGPTARHRIRYLEENDGAREQKNKRITVMIQTTNEASMHSRATGEERNITTILLYSPDMDFCTSLRMLLQDKYNVLTTTDPSMLVTMVRTYRPGLVIADTMPTERMKQRFVTMQREIPGLRIMLFYVSRFEDRKTVEYLQKSLDAVFSKPLDLTEVTRSIHELVG